MTLNEHQLLTPAQAAKMVGRTPSTLAYWRMVGRPHLPFFRIGNRVRYDQRDLEVFLAKHRVDQREGP